MEVPGFLCHFLSKTLARSLGRGKRNKSVYPAPGYAQGVLLVPYYAALTFWLIASMGAHLL